MTLQEWTDALAKRLGSISTSTSSSCSTSRGTPRTTWSALRPVTTFLVGYAAARAGGSAQDVAQAAEVARSLSEELPRSEPA